VTRDGIPNIKARLNRTKPLRGFDVMFLMAIPSCSRWAQAGFENWSVLYVCTRLLWNSYRE